MAQYYFDERSIERIGDAVRKIEKMGGDRNQPAVYQDPIAPSQFRTIIRGTFEGEWAKNETKTVSFTADNGDEATKEDVNNYFATVGDSGETDCVIGLIGSEWVLISAESKPFLVGTFNGVWAKGAYKSVATNNRGTLSVLNLFALVNEDGNSGVSCAIAYDGLWYLIAAECD